jgi:hypothetical protein
MSSEIIGHCWRCGAGLRAADYGREAACLGCGKPTHCCRNCRFYRPGRPNDCFAPTAELVADKLRANFCGYFEPTTTPLRGAATPASNSLRQAAEDLFK